MADAIPKTPHDMTHCLSILFCLTMLTSVAFGQRMKSEKERFTYTQLPSEPLPDGIATFRVHLEQTAKESYGIEFRGWQSEVKAEWKAFQQQWQQIVDEVDSAAPESFAQWQSSRTDTLVLPAAPQPSEYFFDPAEVQYALQLTGFDVGDDGLDVDVVVDPLNITEEVVATKKEKVKRGEETVEVTKFYLKLTYVQPVHITVSARGVTLKSTDANARPRTWSSKTFDRDQQVRDWWAVQKPTILAQQTKMPVLHAVSSLQADLEDKHCTLEKSRECEWHFPKTTGKVNYADLRGAAFDAKFGASKLGSDRTAGEESLRKATVVWAAALSEADFEDKKARIDRKVAGFLYLNLIEAAILMDNLSQAEGYLLEMNKVDAKNGAIKDGERWIEFGRDLERRKAANGL